VHPGSWEELKLPGGSADLPCPRYPGLCGLGSTKMIFIQLLPARWSLGGYQMYIMLHCEECDQATLVTYKLLCSIWSEGLENVSDNRKNFKRKVTAELQCPCGHVQIYDTPMYCYIFGLVFKEFLKDSD
jgi:hypothetical protein